MVAPQDAIEALSIAVANAGKLPSETSVLLQEADQSSEDADVDLPLLEIQVVDVDNVVVSNTDFLTTIKDDDGNETGRVYLSEYEMELEINLWTSTDDGYDPDTLGEELRASLYPYSSYGPDEEFLDQDDNVIDDITYFRLVSGDRTDDIIQTPTVRRWTQNVELWAFEEFRTDENYITSVDYPSNGNFSSDPDGDQISNT